MNINNWIIIGQALICVVLAIVIVCQRVRHLKECDELVLAIEDEQTLRTVEHACSKIFLDHQMKQAEAEIKKLRGALDASEEKRKELCTRLWEEEKLK